MSITYLQEPNAYKEIADVWWLGQTVTLDVKTKVYYLYFERYFGLYRKPIYCDVYLADESHHPVGDPIFRAKEELYVWEKSQVRQRGVFGVYGLVLEAGVEYFFLIRDDEPTFHINSRIYIRQGDSIYEQGKLYYSTNSGVDWTEYPNDDIVFALTGTPEVPPPPPPAPINNFAILDIEQTPTATGMKIVVTTSVPCHLYCYWTSHEPQKHLIPILTRGIELHTQLQYCFVDWTENEQEEPLDTLTHTFIKEPWAVCETRWLTFRAKVMNDWVKSVGPIFKKHRVKPEIPTEMEFAAVINTGYIFKYATTWAAAWSAAIGSPMSGQQAYELIARRPGKGAMTIARGILRFDTSELPDDCEIQSATLKIAWNRNIYPYNYSEICFVPAVGCGDDIKPEDYGALRENIISVCPSIVIPPLEFETYYEKDLYPAGLVQISKTGQTRIGIRGIRDVENEQPSSANRMWVTWYGDQYDPTPVMDARLIVRFL